MVAKRLRVPTKSITKNLPLSGASDGDLISSDLDDQARTRFRRYGANAAEIDAIIAGDPELHPRSVTNAQRSQR